MSDDPFDCFGSDIEDENDDDSSQHQEDSNIKTKGTDLDPTKRDEESCGVLAFHANTERSLLMHVKNSFNSNSNGNIDNTKQQNDLLPCQRVLKEIDWYCSSRHWMMCVGPEKGEIIQNSLQEALDDKLQLMQSSESGHYKFVAVELGTYCGYGSIFLSSMLKTNDNQKRFPHIDFNLFTVEINPEYSSVAREMIQIAQLDDIITVLDNDLMMDGSTGDVGELIKTNMVEKFGPESETMGIDFLMIDHDKDSYLADLKRLELSGLIRRGTIVAADNVIFAGIYEYIDYMKGLDQEGIVKTCTREASVEYSPTEQLLKDGVGM